MKADNNSGVNDLAGVLTRRMASMAASPQVVDYGTIKDDMSLVTDTFPVAIPRKEYTVCRGLTWGETDDLYTETNTASSPEPHKHKVKLPEDRRQLKPKDRVLVVWVGNDPCVVDIIQQGPMP